MADRGCILSKALGDTGPFRTAVRWGPQFRCVSDGGPVVRGLCAGCARVVRGVSERSGIMTHKARILAYRGCI